MTTTMLATRNGCIELVFVVKRTKSFLTYKTFEGVIRKIDTRNTDRIREVKNAAEAESWIKELNNED